MYKSVFKCLAWTAIMIESKENMGSDILFNFFLAFSFLAFLRFLVFERRLRQHSVQLSKASSLDIDVALLHDFFSSVMRFFLKVIADSSHRHYRHHRIAHP